MRKLSSTSYAVLGLLAIQPWSTYELARQMDRSLGFVWPRARSVVYDEPKNLVAHGLAKAKIERYGRRSRTIYSITRAGRTELRRWLARDSAAPQFESEALVRTIFAEHSSKADLLASIASVGRDARELRDAAVAIGHALLADDGPFPGRMHVNALGGRFVLEYAAALERWADWAGDEVRRWPDTSERAAGRGRKALAATLESFDR